jgi:AcrR family transcriptional regulator
MARVGVVQDDLDMADSPSRQPQRVRRHEFAKVRREELVEAALTVISSLGYEAATIRSIAEAAGASPSSVHYYFASREELLIAAFEYHNRRFVERINEQLEDSDSPRERLMTLVRMCFPPDDSSDTEWALIMEVMQRAARNSAIKAASDRGNHEWIERIAGIIREGVASGEFRAGLDPSVIAVEFSALVDGLGFYRRAGIGPGPQRVWDMLRAYITERMGAEFTDPEPGKPQDT